MRIPCFQFFDACKSMTRIIDHQKSTRTSNTNAILISDLITSIFDKSKRLRVAKLICRYIIKERGEQDIIMLIKVQLLALNLR